MEWGLPTRRRAAQLFEMGKGYKAVSTELGVNRETVRDWSYTWRAVGSEGLCSDFSKRPRYPKEVKQSAVRDRLNGDSVVEVMERYQINNRTRLKDWCAQYKKLGASAFDDVET